MSSLNKVILIGRLTRDPELRFTDSGAELCRFTLAVDRPYTKQSGEKEADFINIVAWRRLAEVCAKYLVKGRLAAVEGRLEIRTYTNREGEPRKATQVVADNVQFLSPRQAPSHEPELDFDGIEIDTSGLLF